MNKTMIGFVAVAMTVGLTPVAFADSISGIENARAKERSGYYIGRQDDEKLDRYGGTSQRYGGSYTVAPYVGIETYGYYDGPDVYVGVDAD